jgi:hypothetical protein
MSAASSFNRLSAAAQAPTRIGDALLRHDRPVSVDGRFSIVRAMRFGIGPSL